jgi:argininosuccinate lyase
LIRGKTGRLTGSLVALLTLLKGLPMTYNRDLQEDKESVFDAVDTAKASLEILAEMFGAISVNRDCAARAVSDPSLIATDLADHLVRAGMPFRQAHEKVGRAVARAAELGVGLDALSDAEYAAIAPEFGSDVRAMFDVGRSLAARTAIGAPAPANVETELARWERDLA